LIKAPKLIAMKPHLLILLFCFSSKLFGQKLPDPTRRLDFTIENVKFESAGATLSGTVFKPKYIQSSVVIVHGSGQEKRMANMASLLASNGIAVLTYDKRGVGESGGVYAGPEVGTNNIDSLNLNLLALDASAALNTLAAHIPTHGGSLGLMGFSQAGWVIPIAATINRNVKFMVIFSGPVVTTLEQLRFQFYTQGNTNFWETHTEADAREHINNDIDRYKFTSTDPRTALGKLSIPGLWLYGGKDIQVPVNLSIERLNVLKAKSMPYDYQVFQAYGHNTASSKSNEPMNVAIQWIKGLSNQAKVKD